MILAAGLSVVTPAFGLGVNVEGFGQTLNGWRKDRTAVYTLDNQTYRTHVPTVTGNADGGIFVSTRVDHIAGGKSNAVCYIELTVTPSGYVGASQIRINIGEKDLNTGIVLREFNEAGEMTASDWQTSYTRMVIDLFSRLDTEMEKEDDDEKSSGARDLWGRLNGSKLDNANLAAALRHNLNMLVDNIGLAYATTSSFK